MNTTHIYRLASHIVLNEEEQGAVLLDTRGGKYWQINATTVEVLRILEDGNTVSEAAGILASRSDVERERVEKDLADVIRTLIRSRIVRRVRR